MPCPSLRPGPRPPCRRRRGKGPGTRPGRRRAGGSGHGATPLRRNPQTAGRPRATRSGPSSCPPLRRQPRATVPASSRRVRQGRSACAKLAPHAHRCVSCRQDFQLRPARLPKRSSARGPTLFLSAPPRRRHAPSGGRRTETEGRFACRAGARGSARGHPLNLWAQRFHSKDAVPNLGGARAPAPPRLSPCAAGKAQAARLARQNAGAFKAPGTNSSATALCRTASLHSSGVCHASARFDTLRHALQRFAVPADCLACFPCRCPFPVFRLLPRFLAMPPCRSFQRASSLSTGCMQAEPAAGPRSPGMRPRARFGHCDIL